MEWQPANYIDSIFAVMKTTELAFEIWPEKKFRLVRDLNP